jgi:hypothetical protein
MAKNKKKNKKNLVTTLSPSAAVVLLELKPVENTGRGLHHRQHDDMRQVWNGGQGWACRPTQSGSAQKIQVHWARHLPENR